MMEELAYEELVGPEVIEDEELEAGEKLAAHDLFLRLQGTFSPPAYITLEEVRDATGFDGHRTADAIAVSLYRSRGKAIWGFEMKVSRNDWLKELKQPEKAESIMRYCNYWALVVPDKSIVKAGELPSSWGMYVAQKNRLKCIVPCPKLDPIPMSMTMLTALIYATANKQTKADDAALRAARDEGYKQGVSRTNSDYYEKVYKSLQEQVHAFEDASGLQIEYGWPEKEKIGGIVNQILSGSKNLQSLLNDVNFSIRNADRLKDTLEAHAKELQTVIESRKAGAKG